jgi:hypothetical protein
MTRRLSTRADQFSWDDPDHIEQLLIRAYVRLAYTGNATNGRRTNAVGQFGSFEVRLTEMEPEATLAGLSPFWVEIYSFASGSTIDSYGCFEFDEDELAKAVEFIVEAKRVHMTSAMA